MPMSWCEINVFNVYECTFISSFTVFCFSLVFVSNVSESEIHLSSEAPLLPPSNGGKPQSTGSQKTGWSTRSTLWKEGLDSGVDSGVCCFCYVVRVLKMVHAGKCV